MESVLDIFNPQVTQTADTITVTYCHESYSGTCTYKEGTLNGKKLKQKFVVLTHTDMEDVIEYLYKNGDITGPHNLQEISYEIQRHSRMSAESFIS
jgi:hypothetical protein